MYNKKYVNFLDSGSKNNDCIAGIFNNGGNTCIMNHYLQHIQYTIPNFKDNCTVIL